MPSSVMHCGRWGAVVVRDSVLSQHHAECGILAPVADCAGRIPAPRREGAEGLVSPFTHRIIRRSIQRMTRKHVLILVIILAPFFRDVGRADPVALASARKVLLAHGVNPEKAVLYDGELVLRMGGLDLTEIGFLSGLPVQILELAENYRLTNIDALASMPLRELDICKTAVQSISSLSGCPIEQLLMIETQVRDLSPLRGRPLHTLAVNGSRVCNLTPLSRLPLRALYVAGTCVSNIEALAGLPLRTLVIDNTEVVDIAALKGVPLKMLSLAGTKVRDLNVLTGMPLTELYLNGSGVRDLTPLRGAQIERLELSRTEIEDLSALSGMPLKVLRLSHTQVRNLAALRGMRLERVDCIEAPLTDLSPLAGMPIEYLYISQHQCASLAAILHHFVGIRRINMVYAEDIPGTPGSEDWVQGIVKALDGKFKAALRP